MDNEQTEDLLAAADDGDLSGLAALLDRRPEMIGFRNEFGWTALHRAAQFGHTGMVSLLLDLGADPSCPDLKGSTPLHDASSGHMRSLPSLLTLLRRGSAVDRRNADGETPLMVAAKYTNASAVGVLLSRGADPSLKNRRGQSAEALVLGSLDSAKRGGRKFRQQAEECEVVLDLLRSIPKDASA